MQVTFDIQDDLLAALLAKAQEANLQANGCLEEILREALNQPVAVSTAVEVALQAAMSGATALCTGSEFSLDEVLPDGQWAAMSAGERKSLGRRFRKEAESQRIAEWLRRNSANKAIYLKK